MMLEELNDNENITGWNCICFQIINNELVIWFEVDFR